MEVTNTMAKEKTATKRLALLDTHAIIHRAYHALPDFASTKTGEPTGALYGLSTMILALVAQLKPDYIVAAYDLPEPTHRHKVFAEYKGTRKEIDKELVAQIIRSRDLLEAFAIPVYAEPGFEADDVLGTIVEKTKADAELEVVIASGDMDTLQLVVGDKVRVYTLKKGIKDTIIYDEDGVKERFGFGPELLPDYKGLRGDPSDNIPGIKGVGEKTATDLIRQFGSIEDIYRKLHKDRKQFETAGIKERMIVLLEENEEEALFSKMLATIRRDAPIKWQLPEKRWKESVDMEKIKKLFAELDFKTLASRVDEAINGKPKQASLMSGDDSSETGGGAAASPKAGTPEGDAALREKGFNVEHVAPEEAKKASLALWILDSNISNPSVEDILNWTGRPTFAEASAHIFAELKKQNLWKVYEDIELPLIPITNAMRDYGIGIDLKYLAKLSKEYHTELEKIEKKIYKHAGVEFNINSPKQMGDVLFDKLLLSSKGQKKTAGGARSTRESELEKLREAHPIIGEILDYRELQKLLSTYIDTIPHLVHEDGRLHPTFIQAGAVTGRMASENPNVQNIPIKGELGRRIRDAFVAAPGNTLLELDYSQIELRIAAFLSGDKNLIEVFKSGRDIHTEVAAKMFGIPAEKVDKDMRRKAKTINFGILYGMGVRALQQNLKTTKEEAQLFYDTYFATFPRLSEYMDSVAQEATSRGYTETFYGRRRLFPDLKSRLPYIKAMAERMAINAPIQGTEADVVKIAMIRVDEWIAKEKLGDKVHLLMQIHDSLLYEVDEKIAHEVAPKIRAVMESIMSLKDTAGIVLKANAAIGKNWGVTEEIA